MTVYADNPFFADDARSAEEAQLDGKPVVQTEEAKKSVAREVSAAERQFAMLMNSTTWGPKPAIPYQEDIAPETVAIHNTAVEVLDLTDPEHASKYAMLIASNATRGTYRFLRGQKEEFSPRTGKYTALVIYQERRFKQFEEAGTKKPFTESAEEHEDE